MTSMRLYDTAAQEVVPFEPGMEVNLYTCGITPYDATHLGHAATFVTYDVVERRLRDRGHDTRLVRNITDVDDPLLVKANELDIHYLDLAAAEVQRFDEDMEALGNLEPYATPRATSAIGEIRKVIGELIERGHAYERDGWVFFEVATYPAYGELSHYDRDTMLRLSAERGADPNDARKRDGLDFVMWRPSEEGEPAWESLWGPGRPGWHIECTALARRELGVDTVDLHGGGTDLIYPHHESSAAQSTALTGKPLAHHWVHQAMVGMGGEKMSKSKGNLVFVSELRKDWDPRALRLLLLAEHYRNPWQWHPDRPQQAQDRLERWVEAGDGDGALDEVRLALDDDLDTPRALAAVDAAAADGQGVSRAAALLGVPL